jgi:hypothetical protein
MNNYISSEPNIPRDDLPNYLNAAKKMFLEEINLIITTPNQLIDDKMITDFDIFFSNIKKTILSFKPAKNCSKNEKIADDFIRSLILEAIDRDWFFLTFEQNKTFFITNQFLVDPVFLGKINGYYCKSLAKNFAPVAIGAIITTIGYLAHSGIFSITPWLAFMMIGIGITCLLLGLFPARNAIKLHKEMSIFNSRQIQNQNEVQILDNNPLVDIDESANLKTAEI